MTVARAIGGGLVENYKNLSWLLTYKGDHGKGQQQQQQINTQWKGTTHH